MNRTVYALREAKFAKIFSIPNFFSEVEKVTRLGQCPGICAPCRLMTGNSEADGLTMMVRFYILLNELFPPRLCAVGFSDASQWRGVSNRHEITLFGSSFP